MSHNPKAGLLGHPVSHSLSPRIMRWLAGETGVALDYDLWDVQDHALADTLGKLRGDPNWVGANVTVPHKSRILQYVDGTSDEVDRIGAANVLVKTGQSVIAHNTDKVGFRRALGLKGCALVRRRVLLLGAGGAARAVLLALLEGDVNEVVILNRTRSRAQELAAFDPARVRLLGLDDPVDFDLIINSTSLGLRSGDRTELTQLLAQVSDSIRSEAGTGRSQAIDLVYPKQGGPTLFLEWAESHGITAVMDGLPMLAAQAVASFSLWTSTTFPEECVHKLLVELAH